MADDRTSSSSRDRRRRTWASTYAAAEESEIAAKSLRPIVASVLSRLHDAGVTMEQAVSIARAAVSSRKKKE